jgi:hypothetical protein
MRVVVKDASILIDLAEGECDGLTRELNGRMSP